MIPKIIHYVWVGNSPKTELVLKCIESWKKFCPDYEIIEWNNDSLKEINNLYVNQALEAKKWAFVSDYLRLYALKKFGGFYFDTDLEITQNIDEFLNNEFVSGYENWRGYYSPITALMGAKKDNKIISDLLGEYDNLRFVDEFGAMDLTPNTQRITNYFEKKYNLKPPYNSDEKVELGNDGVIYPSNYFCTPQKDKINYSIHHFNGSWKEDFDDKYSFLEKMFSVKTSSDKKHIILSFFGFRAKFRRK